MVTKPSTHKAFLVIGMHRSATSLVAKGLHQAGVHMGNKLLGPHPSNPWGHYEDIPAIHINDEILGKAGGTWDDPPYDSKIAETDPFTMNKIRDYVRTRKEQSLTLWGLKDPRLCLTWKLWNDVMSRFGLDIHLITIRRDVEEIARSLRKRNNMPLDQGKYLARYYQERMP